MSFLDQKSVLIVTGRLDVRSLLRDVVKELGATEVVSSDNPQDVWNILGSGKVPDWIVASANFDLKENYNTFHLLNAILQVEAFKETQVSLLVEEKDFEYIPVAFELGALSIHKGPFTKNTMTSDLQKVFKDLEDEGGKGPLVAARYLRDVLADSEQFEDLIKLEKALASAFPKKPELVLKLVEAHFQSGDVDQAKKVLAQAKFLGKELETGVKQLEDLIGVEKEDEGANFAEVFNLKKAVIVEPDTTASNQVQEALKALGVAEIVCFDDGVAAFEALKEASDVDLVIQEWKIPKLSGPQLVQRLRNDVKFGGLVVVASSLVSGQDLLLLREIGVDNIVEKPLDATMLVRMISQVIREGIFPTQPKTLATNIRVALKVNR